MIWFLFCFAIKQKKETYRGRFFLKCQSDYNRLTVDQGQRITGSGKQIMRSSILQWDHCHVWAISHTVYSHTLAHVFAAVMNQIKTVVFFLKHLDCDISKGNFKKFLLWWSGLIMKEHAHSVENLLWAHLGSTWASFARGRENYQLKRGEMPWGGLGVVKQYDRRRKKAHTAGLVPANDAWQNLSVLFWSKHTTSFQKRCRNLQPWVCRG